jgi:GNAT superfamily N-acetyltransferase
MDFYRVHSWLTTTYCSPGIALEKVERAARHSALVIRAFEDGVQVGYARVVSDQTTFAWVCDVFVDEAFRGRGIARAMVAFAMADENLQGLRRWVLATADAHGAYAALGLADPESGAMDGAARERTRKLTSAPRH